MIMLSVAALATAIPLFAGCLWFGLQAIPRALPLHLLAAWDVLLLNFLCFWSAGLLTDLQRSEPLALSRFLHLPVSPSGAFLINFLSSLLSLSLIVFTPIMLAFALALVMVKGAVMLPSLAGLGAFLLMITALNYQFRGWVASLMSNPRTKRTVVAAATGLFILVLQIPNLVNLYAPWQHHEPGVPHADPAEVVKLVKRVESGEIDVVEFERQRRSREATGLEAERLANEQTIERYARIARVVNMVLPVGWLPLGVMDASEGNVLPSVLGFAGMGLIGVVSLRRAYLGTMQLYKGGPTNEKPPPAQVGATEPVRIAATSPATSRPGRLILEARLPGLSEPVSAIALAGFRSLVRAPEAKMMLLGSLIMVAVFGSMVMRNGSQSPLWSRPLAGIGAMLLVLFSLTNVMANQFGLDRDGFKVFVLSAARRRDILMGKNLALAPLAFGVAFALLLLVQVFRPMRLDHLLAMPAQYVSMYLLCCIITNMMSIFAPVHVPSGSLRPAQPTLSTALLQMLTLMVLFPAVQSLTLLPLGAEYLLDLTGQTPRLPLCLVLTLVQCAVVATVYAWVLGWQGGLLHQREQTILERVTARAE